MRTTAFPDLPFVVGTNEGYLYFRLVDGRPAGPKVHVCDGAVMEVVALQRQALAFCGSGVTDAGWYLWDEAAAAIALIVRPALGQAAFTGTGSVVYVALGREAPPAPIPMTRLMLRDLASGTTTQVEEAFGVSAELRLTGEGVAVWRPRNNDSFVRPDAEAGTWVLRGTALSRFSGLRLIEGGAGRALLEAEVTLSRPGCCRSVYTRIAAEQRLTPNDVSDEHALALLDDGAIVTWRPGPNAFEGDIVVYRGGTVARLDRGHFSSVRAMRSGDWIVVQQPADPQLLAYRISDGSFASVPDRGFRSLATLGSR